MKNTTAVTHGGVFYVEEQQLLQVDQQQVGLDRIMGGRTLQGREPLNRVCANKSYGS